MGDESSKPTRRDLFKVGAAIAGATVLQPWTLRLLPEQRGQPLPFPVPSTFLPSAETSLEADVLPRSLPRSQTQRANVVLIVMDTTRADHLSCYGYRRETTPNLDRFAAEARWYTNALSPAPWTLPAHSALFTGLSCSAHGFSWLHRSLDKRFPTLAEQLAAHGYQTVGLSSNPTISPGTELNRGFQTFWNSASYGVAAGIAPAMHEQLAGWLKKGYDPGKPFFLFLNYIEPHQPYSPPESAVHFASHVAWERWEGQDQETRSFDYTLTRSDLLSDKDIFDLQALYDDELRYMDRQIGRVLGFLKSTGLEENTLVAITADHGEHFGEHHYMEHQFSLYRPLVHVPLLVRHPGRLTAGKEDRLVQSHDVYPTILEAAGLDWKPLPGQTCRSLLGPSAPGRLAVSEYLEPFPVGLDRVPMTYPEADCSQFNRRLRAIQRDKLKLISAFELGARLGHRLELYDVDQDPMETHDLAREKPAAAGELAAALNAWAGSFEHYAADIAPRLLRPYTPSPDERKAMRGLGYTQ